MDELKEQYREAAEKAKGRAEGGSSLVRRQAGLKFGADAADEPTRLEGGIADPECIARIGDLTIECEMGTDLLELTARSAGSLVVGPRCVRPQVSRSHSSEKRT